MDLEYWVHCYCESPSFNPDYVMELRRESYKYNKI
jgi:hypothetical protein